MEEDNVNERLLPVGEMSSDRPNARNITKSNEDVRHDLGYQRLSEEHAIEIEPNVSS